MVKKQDRLEECLNPSRYSISGVNGRQRLLNAYERTIPSLLYSAVICFFKILVSSCLVLEFA